MLAQRYQKKMLKCNKNNYKSTLVSDPTSRRFIRWLLFQTFIYINIYNISSINENR